MSMSSEKFDPAILATLTDEERAAIEEDALTEAEREAMVEIADDDDSDDSDDDSNDGDDAGSDDHEDSHPATKVVSSTADADENEKAFRPQYKAELPADFDAQLADLKSQRTSLQQRFNDGDIDSSEYALALDENSDRRSELNSAKIKFDISADMEKQTGTQQWEWTANKFMLDAKSAGDIDYTKDKEKRDDFFGFMKVLAEKPENFDKDFDWFLSQGHKRTLAFHGLIGTMPGHIKKSEKGRSRTPPTGSIAQNLANVPGGDGPGDVGNEFAALDRLEGFEFETALARLSKADQDRYLKA
jgi:hypothetical protein